MLAAGDAATEDAARPPRDGAVFRGSALRYDAEYFWSNIVERRCEPLQVSESSSLFERVHAPTRGTPNLHPVLQFLRSATTLTSDVLDPIPLCARTRTK